MNVAAMIEFGSKYFVSKDAFALVIVIFKNYANLVADFDAAEIHVFFEDFDQLAGD